MGKSGMRYLKTKKLISDIGEKKVLMEAVFKRMEEERVPEVAAVYGGAAADNFKNNVITVSSDLLGKVDNIMKQLNEEAETQHDNYKKQEAALQSDVQVK